MPQHRQATIERLEAVLSVEPIAWPVPEAARVSPFSAVEAEVQTVSKRPDTPPPPGRNPPVVVEPTRLSDHAALDEILPTFKPTGALVMGNRRILKMANSKKYEEGHILSYNVRGETYRLVIEKVTMNGYTLRLGNTHVQRSFKINE